MYQPHNFDFHKNTIAFGDCQCECFAFFATPAAAQRLPELRLPVLKSIPCRVLIQQITCFADLGDIAGFYRISKSRPQRVGPNFALRIDRNESNLCVAPVLAA